MSLRDGLTLSFILVLAVWLTAREIWRRLCVHYEYRWDSFAIRGPFGRQLFQIRQSEIESLKPLGLVEGISTRGITKFWPRTHFGRRVVIRARMTRRPVVISWEGQPIAGLAPEGLKLRSPKGGKRR